MSFFDVTKRVVTSTAIVGTLGLSACGYDANGNPRFCEQNREVCAAVAFVIIGGIVAADANGGSSGSGNSGSGGGTGSNASDPRIKTDIKYLRTLENGIRLYAFRYIGQDEGFVGVLADELLEDPRYAHAVIPGPGGSLLVDYELLPVQLMNYDAMEAASERALAQITGGRTIGQIKG